LIDPFASPRRIARALDYCSPRTCDRRLQEQGLYGRVAQHKMDYNEEQIENRLSFAERYTPWTEEKWSKVLFSDEKCFYGAGFCGNTYVRRPVGAAFNPEYTVNKTARPVKVNVWACFSAVGPGYIHIFYNTLDSASYKKILDDHLLGVAKRDFVVPPPAIAEWHFLHDNAPMHTSGIVAEWLHNKGVSVIDFPAYSPDLNPIENLWSIMAREVERFQCSTDEELGDVIIKVWNELRTEVFRNLARSMPRRCAAVVAAKGWHTKY